MGNSETDGEPGRALDESGHRVLERKGLGSQKSFLQWCEPEVGTQQRSLLTLKWKSAAERRRENCVGGVICLGTRRAAGITLVT